MHKHKEGDEVQEDTRNRKESERYTIFGQFQAGSVAIERYR
jgi:hypothetical protein